MLRQLTILMIICSLGTTISAQVSNKLFPYRDGNKWGYCDRNGKVVIAPQWDAVETFGHVGGKVMIGKGLEAYYCLVDEKGKYIIPPELHWTGQQGIINSYAIMNAYDSNGHAGRIDTNGNFIIPMEYDAKGGTSFMGQNAYILARNGKWGVVRRDGKVMLDCKYDGIWNTSPGDFTPPAYLVRLNDSTSAVVDTNGQPYLTYSPVCTPRFWYTDTLNTVFYEACRKFWIWEHYPEGPRKQLPFEMQRLYMKEDINIDNIYSIMDTNGKWGFADPRGNVLIEPQYNEVYGDTSPVIIAEKRLHTDDPKERYEYVHLDMRTLKPIGQPIRAARSGIETARRREDEGEDEQFDEGSVMIERQANGEEDDYEEVEPIIAKKVGDHLIHVLEQTDTREEGTIRQEAHLPIAVYTTGKELLGYTLANDNLKFTLPPQPYAINAIYLEKPANLVIFENEGRYALADTNLNILVDFQDRYFIPVTYFTNEGRHYIITTYNRDKYINWYEDKTQTYLVSADGKIVQGFEKYNYVSLMDNQNLWGNSVRHLAVKDSTGMMGIVDLHGKVLYPDVSFKYQRIIQLGDDLFKTSDKKGRNITIVNSKNKNLFPGSKIWGVSYAMPYYFQTPIEKPIPGIYIVYFNSNRDYFYMNETGKAFMKNVDITAPPER